MKGEAKEERAPVRAGKIVLGIFAGLFSLIALCVCFLAIAEGFADRTARQIPSYEKIDLAPLLEKEEWSDEDYDILYHQTGLGRSALDELQGRNAEILRFQAALFYEGELIHEQVAPTTPHDMLKDYVAPLAPLHNGDVLVTSSCHTFGWRNGHAAIVVTEWMGDVLESVGPGVDSCIGAASWFQKASNFLLLRLKDVPRERCEEIAATACERLIGIPYSLTVGLFSPKDAGERPAGTNCSHLVWQAFSYFGYDIDSDGGPVCTARDIANSPYFEVVQVFGFDPDKLW